MKTKVVFLAFFFLTVFSSGFCIAADVDLTSLRRVADSDPQKDFAEFFMVKEDRRFVGIQSSTMEVPGVPDYYENYSKDYGVWVIPGTSGDILNEEHKMLIDKARKYAEEYNRLVLEWIKDNKK